MLCTTITMICLEITISWTLWYNFNLTTQVLVAMALLYIKMYNFKYFSLFMDKLVSRIPQINLQTQSNYTSKLFEKLSHTISSTLLRSKTLLQEILQELQDIPRKGPFPLHSCKILQDLWPARFLQNPTRSCKILQECKIKGPFLQFLQYFLLAILLGRYSVIDNSTKVFPTY